jgi:NTE family protein
MDAQDSSHLHSDDWQRTIYIDTLGVKTTEFDLSDQRKMDLVESGRNGVRIFFDWFDKVPVAANKP